MSLSRSAQFEDIRPASGELHCSLARCQSVPGNNLRIVGCTQATVLKASWFLLTAPLLSSLWRFCLGLVKLDSQWEGSKGSIYASPWAHFARYRELKCQSHLLTTEEVKKARKKERNSSWDLNITCAIKVSCYATNDSLWTAHPSLGAHVHWYFI